MLILILTAGKSILIECSINWLTMKVTNFVIDFCRSRGTTVKYSDRLTASSSSEGMSDQLSCMEMAENVTEETAKFHSYLKYASIESPNCISSSGRPINWSILNVFQIHLQHYVIPATSAAIERAVIVAGHAAIEKIDLKIICSSCW